MKYAFVRAVVTGEANGCGLHVDSVDGLTIFYDEHTEVLEPTIVKGWKLS